MTGTRMYAAPGSPYLENRVQDVVDLVWFSDMADDLIVVDEWIGYGFYKRAAVWKIPVPPYADRPPTANFSHRIDLET